MGKVCKAFNNDVADGMVFDTYVFHISVMRVILSKEACGIIVAMRRGWARGAKTEIDEEVMKEEQFLTCMM